MSNTTAEKALTRKVRPFYGHGMVRVKAPLPSHTEDMFEAKPDEDTSRQFHLRCASIQQYLAGSRPTPDVLECELNAGTLLGSDEFDMQFARDGIFRRCG